MKRYALLLAAAALTATACSTPTAVGDPNHVPTSEADLLAPPTTATPSPTYGQVYTDDMGVKHAKLDPAAVTIRSCKAISENDPYLGMSHRVESEYEVTNTTPLNGTISLEVNYINSDGVQVTPGVPGANNVKPGRTARMSDTAGVQKGDFPGGKVTCEVAAAEVYIPVQ